MSNYKEFKVIKIIDEYSIVINGGLNEDVTIEEEVEIFIKGDSIEYDGEVLGTLDFIKERLEVTEVYLNFSVCKKIVKEKVYQPSGLERALASYNLFGGNTVTKISEGKIKVKQEEITGRKTGDETIRLGDSARIVISD